MATVNSPLRELFKPILFKLLGNRGYFYVQYLAKLKDIRNRLVEEKEMELLPLLVHRGDQVIDIGANYAYYTTRLSELVGPQGKVFAFEPIPFTYRICRKILNHHKIKNVELFQKGVGVKEETLIFNVPIVSFGAISAGLSHIGSRVNPDEGREENYAFDKHQQIGCDVVSLDSFMRNKLTNLSFIKIDIEGAEFFALQGMKDILTEFHPTVLLEVQPYFLKGYNIDVDKFVTFIKKDLGYNIFYFDSSLRKLLSLDCEPSNNNYLLIHSAKMHLVAHLLK